MNETVHGELGSTFGRMSTLHGVRPDDRLMSDVRL